MRLPPESEKTLRSIHATIGEVLGEQFASYGYIPTAAKLSRALDEVFQAQTRSTRGQLAEMLREGDWRHSNN